MAPVCTRSGLGAGGDSTGAGPTWAISGRMLFLGPDLGWSCQTTGLPWVLDLSSEAGTEAFPGADLGRRGPEAGFACVCPELPHLRTRASRAEPWIGSLGTIRCLGEEAGSHYFGVNGLQFLIWIVGKYLEKTRLMGWEGEW